MSHWFISYAHLNTKTVNRYKKLLDTVVGAESIWRDDQIKPASQNWWNELIIKIEACGVFVPMLSTAFFKSLYCPVELAHATNFNKPVLPILLEKDLFIPKEISYVQYVDFSDHLSDQDVIEMFELAKSQLEVEIRLNPPKLPKSLPIRPDDPAKKEATPSLPIVTSKIPQILAGATKPIISQDIDLSVKDLQAITVEQCMVRDPLFVYDDAKMGDAWLKIVGDGRPPYLVVKRKIDERIAGWLTIGILADVWPTLLWRQVGLSAIEYNELVEKIAHESVRLHMVSLGTLEYMTPDMSFEKALECFISPIPSAGRNLSVRAYPVRDQGNRAVGSLDYRHLLAKASILNLIADISVEDCMVRVDSTDYIFVKEEETFRQVEFLVENHGWTSIALTNKNNQLVGMISREKIKQYTDGRFPQIYDMQVKPHLRKPGDSYCTRPNSKLSDWISLFITDRQIDTLAVTKAEDDHTLLGLLRYTDILRVILQQVQNRK
jgi:predicted transcriptional regulator